LDPKLIYDVGMHNGDDTAYYLWRGFRVVAIEPNPELVATAANRFRREIEAGYLKILNAGVAAEEGELPFWVCETDSRLSSFAPPLDSFYAAHEIRVPCRKFRSILDDFGVPFYLKVDIQGNDFLCIEALDPGELPKFLCGFGEISISRVGLRQAWLSRMQDLWNGLTRPHGERTAAYRGTARHFCHAMRKPSKTRR
jgi:FkbM family methyltransferase